MGVSERQIQKLEGLLFEAGTLTWCDLGNHQCYGRRDPQLNLILYIFGVDLTPLAYLKTVLEYKIHQKQLYEKALLEKKREIFWHHSRIGLLLLEVQEEGPIKNGFK